ncbi:MAG TPA: response regulator [Planctomycetota bacterium]|nr:response regulator [Planctomycetota bacterium]
MKLLQPVLIVDDDPRIATAIGLTLERLGFQVLLAPDALEAVALARRVRPSVILMDVMMPGMEGSVAAALMKDCEELQEIPILLLSALPEEELRSRAAEIGAAGYVAKPFRKAELLRALRSVLAHPAFEPAGS